MLALKCCCIFTCFQHICPAFELHGVQLPSFKVFKSFWTLTFSIQCVPMISWMFLFCINGAISSILKISLKFWFICKVFQFFLMVLAVFSRNQWYVITRGILSDFSCVSFSVIRSILLYRLILSRCPLINDGCYLCFTKLFFISLRLLFKSTWFELICLIWMAWL